MNARRVLSPVLRKRCFQMRTVRDGVKNKAVSMLLVRWSLARNKHLVTISLLMNSEVRVNSGLMFRVMKSTTE